MGCTHETLVRPQETMGPQLFMSRAAHLLELLQLAVPEHDEPVLAGGEVALVRSRLGAGVDRARVAGGAPVHAVSLNI